MMESVAPDNPILVIKLMLLVWVDHGTKLEVGSVMNAAGVSVCNQQQQQPACRSVYWDSGSRAGCVGGERGEKE